MYCFFQSLFSFAFIIIFLIIQIPYSITNPDNKKAQEKQSVEYKKTLVWASSKVNCKVIQHSYGSKRHYSCHGIQFSSYERAVEFAKKFCNLKRSDSKKSSLPIVKEIQTRDSIRRKSLPKKIKSQCEVQVTEKCYLGFDIRPYLGKRDFCNRVWHTVWFNFPYTKFSRNNFDDMRDRFLREINSYRRLHKANYLLYSLELANHAQKHADNLAKGYPLVRDYYVDYGETVGAAFYPAASIIVKKWYEERFLYKFGSRNAVYGTQMFTQMVWRASQRIGIGIAQKGDYIFLVCKYSPKGNKRGEYRTNVLSSSSENQKTFMERIRILLSLKRN
uniref:PDZ domain-containing protein n=1 Tax=Strongyloides stercoralis TaxID=6248 RepID=A0A0K0EE01_STRER